MASQEGRCSMEWVSQPVSHSVRQSASQPASRSSSTWGLYRAWN